MSPTLPAILRFPLAVPVLAGLLCPGPPARADGGHIALHATSGPLTVTLFTAPEPLVPGRGDLSLLLQDAGTDQVLTQATAQATMQQVGTPPQPLYFSRSPGANPLLLLAAPTFPSRGEYTLILSVAQPAGAPQRFSVVLNVAEDHGRRTTLLVGLGLPVAVIVLFLINQNAKDPHPKASREVCLEWE